MFKLLAFPINSTDMDTFIFFAHPLLSLYAIASACEDYMGEVFDLKVISISQHNHIKLQLHHFKGEFMKTCLKLQTKALARTVSACIIHACQQVSLHCIALQLERTKFFLLTISKQESFTFGRMIAVRITFLLDVSLGCDKMQ